MNNNIKETYCTFEISKLLKEKGFECKTYYGYDSKGLIVQHSTFLSYSPGEPEIFAEDYLQSWLYQMPTQAVAIEWVRVNYNLHIYSNYLDDILLYGFTILNIKNNEEMYEKFKFNTPQEALEAGLLYTLKNLI